MQNRKKKHILFVCLLLTAGLLSGCGNEMKEKDSASLVRDAIEAHQNDDKVKLAKCYGINQYSLFFDDEVMFENFFFQAVNAKKVEIVNTETLLQEPEYDYVGIYYQFVLDKDKTIPYYERFLVKHTGDNFRIVTRGSYSETIKKKLKENIRTFESTDLYQQYQQAEKKYGEEHPGYANQVYKRLRAQLSNPKIKVRQSSMLLLTVFAIAIAQLILLSMWARNREIHERNRRRKKKRGRRPDANGRKRKKKKRRQN